MPKLLIPNLRLTNCRYRLLLRPAQRVRVKAIFSPSALPVHRKRNRQTFDTFSTFSDISLLTSLRWQADNSCRLEEPEALATSRCKRPSLCSSRSIGPTQENPSCPRHMFAKVVFVRWNQHVILALLHTMEAGSKTARDQRNFYCASAPALGAAFLGP